LIEGVGARTATPFRVRFPDGAEYRNAERELSSTGYDLPALLAAGEPLPKMPGIGPELSAKIREIWQTGTSKTLEKLRKDYPAGILDLLRLPGVGPKRVRLFYGKLGIGSLDELEQVGDLAEHARDVLVPHAPYEPSRPGRSITRRLVE